MFGDVDEGDLEFFGVGVAGVDPAVEFAEFFFVAAVYVAGDVGRTGVARGEFAWTSLEFSRVGQPLGPGARADTDWCGWA